MDIASLSLVAATGIGFAHAFEADHLVAVSSIVTRRDNFREAAKDGVYWGLGHTSTIFLIGAVMIVGKIFIPESTFEYLEAAVGCMLVGLGIWRLIKLWSSTGHDHTHPQSHGISYSIGLIHGLAGSGVLVLAIISKMENAYSGMLFLLVFGIGSTLGMLVASGIFSVPLWKRSSWSKYLSKPLTVISALLCLGLGLYIIYENLFSQ